MNTNVEIASIIRNRANEMGISLKELLNECDLNINYITSLERGQNSMLINISKIADVLNLSVDYILGRSVSGLAGVVNNQNNINGNNTINHDSGGERSQDRITDEIIDNLSKCTKSQKLQILQAIYDILE